MSKIFFLAGTGIGTIIVLSGTYSILANVRKAEVSYALSPSPLQGEAMNSCYPTTFYSPQQVRYVDAGNGYRYYEAIAQPRFETSGPYATLYIRTSGQTCKWLNRNDLASGRLTFMPEPVAIALAKLQYSELLDQCRASLTQGSGFGSCTEQLESEINQPPDWTAAQINYLFPDDALALKELGIKTDRVLVVRSVQELENLRPKISTAR
uniref:Uncharacterized protein n=1 Tax=Cyanothece sp. (strain PCC 7425 / ATCC 29141) TaxID=395961 RepID=B8HZ11_CYAP4